MLNQDGYPTNATLRRVEKWKIRNHVELLALFEYIRQNWWAADWGFHHTEQEVNLTYANATCKKKHHFQLSTGGWSGNEDMVHSMRKNYVFWSMTWRVHKAGGHYDFEVEELEFTGK
jgi:hypothetical protein